MRCELFFSYEKDLDVETINNYIETIPNPKQIVTDNSILHEFLQKNGNNSKMISEFIPDDGPIAEEIYKKSKILHNEYKKTFKDLEYNGILIFSGFDNPLFRQLIILFKAEKILEEKINTVFIFTGFFDIFFVIKKIAKEIGYSSSENIGIIEGKKISYFNYNSSVNVKSYQERFSRKRTYNFLKYSFGKKITLNNIKIIYNSLIQICSLLTKQMYYKIRTILNTNYNELLINKIYQKLKSNQNTKIAFFVTTSREDLYLKPWYPVFELLKKSSTSYEIFTSDLATSIVLSKENIPFINLFNYLYGLEREIKKFDIWNEIKIKLENIVKENNSIIGMNELSNYFQSQSRRTLAIILILDIIIKTRNLKSIVAIADGEMLENIAVSYAKKNNIQNFSLLPGYISPQPFLSEWFKVNKIFVHGLDGYEALLKLGYEKNKLLISGNPKYDFLNTLISHYAKKILEDQIRIDSKKPLIIIAMSRWHDNDELWMSNFIKYCNDNHFEIIIKIHPVYKSAARQLSEIKLDKISKNCKNMKYVISYDLDVPTLLSAAELIITDFSNVGIEAILLDRPLLTVNFSNESFEYVLRYHEYGSSLYIEKYQDLEKITKEIIIEKKYLRELSNGRRKIIELVNYKNDGKAGERILNSLNH